MSPRTKKLLKRVAPILVVGVVFLFVLPKIADFESVLDSLRTLSWSDIAILTFVTILNLATFGPPWMAAMPGLKYMQSMQLTMASTALANAAPGGDAAGMAMSYHMLRVWGMAPARVAAAVLATGVWNQLVNVGIPAISAGLLAANGQSDPLLTLAALIGLGVLVAVSVAIVAAMRSDEAAARVGQWLDRFVQRLFRWIRRPRDTNIEHHVLQFRGEAADLAKARWHWLTIWTLIGHLTVFFVLLACLRTLGVSSDEVSFLEALASWSLVRLLTAIPITPGGLGIVELGLTTALVGFGGSNAEVVAAVLLYRALTFLPPLPLGALASLTWRRSHPGDAELESPS